MDERAAWDLFWSYDRLASFGTGRGAGNYAPHISDGWRAFFAALPIGSRVLDIATGNGAVAVLAVEAGDSLQITGADLAAVEPAAFVSDKRRELQRIQFLAGTPAEALPLDDAGFDAVVSQYGVEYSDMERSLPESVRVLAPGGRLRFACHAVEGSVVADTKWALADADFLLEEIDLIGKAAAGFTAILDVERGLVTGPFAQSAAQAKYGEFRTALQAVAGRTRTAADADMLASVHRSLTELFQDRLSHEESAIEAQLAALRTEVEAHRERERALLAAARSAGQMAELAGRLAGLGLADVALGEQRGGANLVGHLIEARKP